MFCFAGCLGSDLVNTNHGGKHCEAPEGCRCLWVNREAHVQVVFNETTAVYHVKSQSHCVKEKIRMCKSDGYWDGESPSFFEGKEKVHSLYLGSYNVPFILHHSVDSESKLNFGLIGTIVAFSVGSTLYLVVGAALILRESGVIISACVMVILFPTSIMTYPIVMWLGDSRERKCMHIARFLT